MLESSEEQAIEEIALSTAKAFSPFASHEWEKHGLRAITTCPIYTAIFGYHDYQGSYKKYVVPNVNLVMNPKAARCKGEHLGLWTDLSNFFVPLAMLASVVGEHLVDKRDEFGANTALYNVAIGFWWLLRAPLMGMALIIDALKRIALVLAVVAAVAAVSPLLLLGGIFVVVVVAVYKQAQKDADPDAPSLFSNLKNAVLPFFTHENVEENSLNESSAALALG